MTDNKLAKMPLANWGGLNFRCRCGGLHHVDVKEIVMRDDACALVTHFAKKMGRTMHLVFEQKVFESVKDKVCKKLDKAFDVTASILPDCNRLSADICDEVLSQAKEETKVLVCVGGKNANAYGKYVSAKTGWQWIFVNVLPDCDDVATGYAMLWREGTNQMLPGKAPDVILCDLNLAQSFCVSGVGEAFALILRNMLVVFDNSFANTVQNANICNTSNYLLTSAVKDCINLTKKPFSKNTVEGIFACLYRISMAKCLSKANVDNFSGMHSFIFALQGKYPEYSEGMLACAVADTLAKIYETILKNDCKLTIDKDRLAHSQLVKKHFGVDIDSAYQWNVDDEAYGQNRQNFLGNVALVKKVNNLCKVLVQKNPQWDKDVAQICLQVASDIYAYNGLLSYANDKGMFDKQNDKQLD